jgi:hypothetical protein
MLELEARIIAATMIELGIGEMCQSPSTGTYEDLGSMSKQAKVDCLNSLACKVVDTYILRKDKVETILEKTREAQDAEKSENVKEGERFPCRFPGCQKSFKHDGKRRRDHEKTHGSFVAEQHSKPSANSSQNVAKSSDDMFNYQSSFLEVGMLLANFYDAISEGDGQRVVRCWKFILLYLVQDGASSRKYALEAFYLLCQINSTLSPRAAHRLIWNRFYKTKSCPGGNIPLDLALEHFNRLIKILIRNLGPNGLNKRAIDRYCDALAVNKSILDNFDTLCGVTRRSGKHYCRSVAADLQKIVKELLDQNALVFQEKRDLSHFQGFQDSLLSNSDLRSLFKWITTHKKNVHLKKCAR